MRNLIWLLLAPLQSPFLAPAEAQEVRELFLVNCATCHGEKGDGKGKTPLEKPARSFLDGGFSYGNTRAAIGRTLEYGIPGTPMPSFAQALTEEQRASLVEYVISLGPPRKEVKAKDTVLAVTDRPQIVRGFLPALQEGAPEYPRGLLVGMTSGTTFQYRADDMRLVAVRQGDFVERRDWGGRGGNPLNPLGTITHAVGNGRPQAEWYSGDDALRARLKKTHVRGDQVSLTYELLLHQQPIALVTERPAVLQAASGSGFVREYVVQAYEDVILRHHPGDPLQDAEEQLHAAISADGPSVQRTIHVSGTRMRSVSHATPLTLKDGDVTEFSVHEATLISRDHLDAFIKEVM